METYCVPHILEKINKLDGLDEGRLVPTKFDLKSSSRFHQLGLFDASPEEHSSSDENGD